MSDYKINKIIYFDKETIRNILQEREHGQVSKKTDIASVVQSSGSVSAAVSLKYQLDVPFLSRMAFLFNGKLDASYVVKKDGLTTISSTEISDFEKIKKYLICKKDIQVADIENSSTFLRVAGGYVKMVKGGVDGLDTNEFKKVMDSYDGYDTYSIDHKTYVRFNNEAFVSNYKRNDLLTTKMTLYCISVGVFNKKRFDFIEEMNKMQRLIDTTRNTQSLADIYPPQTERETLQEKNEDKEDDNTIELYDVLYACVTSEVTNEQ